MGWLMYDNPKKVLEVSENIIITAVSFTELSNSDKKQLIEAILQRSRVLKFAIPIILQLASNTNLKTIVNNAGIIIANLKQSNKQ